RPGRRASRARAPPSIWRFPGVLLETMNNSSPILLIEDRAVDIDLTTRAFARCRILNPIQVARDGEEALAYIERWESGDEVPVFILLDLGLPKVSGLEVLH